MKSQKIPKISDELYDDIFQLAKKSIRHRHAHILHKTGAEFNEVFNLMLNNSYMHPHLHPSAEKIEEIHILRGSVCFFFFDDYGNIMKKINLRAEEENFISVPAFSWHTYVITSEVALTYETMIGKYDPKTWKTLAKWAPEEQSGNSFIYLKDLKNHVKF